MTDAQIDHADAEPSFRDRAVIYAAAHKAWEIIATTPNVLAALDDAEADRTAARFEIAATMFAGYAQMTLEARAWLLARRAEAADARISP